MVSIGYIFAVERPSEKVGGIGPSATDNLAEMTAINTMRRIKEEIAWRNDEDSFYYRYDIMHTKAPSGNKKEKSALKQTYTPSTSSATKDSIASLLLSSQHPHELTEIDITKQQQSSSTPCDLCQSLSSKRVYYCAMCRWSICSDCFEMGKSVVNMHGYDMNESIVNNKCSKDESTMKVVRANSPINHGFSGPLFASSPSKKLLTPSFSSSTLPPPSASSAPNSPKRGTQSNCSVNKNGDIFTTKVGSNEILVDKTPLPYPRTIFSDLLSNEFSLAADFRRQRVRWFIIFVITNLYFFVNLQNFDPLYCYLSL